MCRVIYRLCVEIVLVPVLNGEFGGDVGGVFYTHIKSQIPWPTVNIV